MVKFKLNANQILDKSFNIDDKGYAALEVDQFLDDILEDYQTFDEVIKNYENIINELRVEIASHKAKNIELESNIKVNELQNNNSYSSIDILKRLSRLEREVFKNFE